VFDVEKGRAIIHNDNLILQERHIILFEVKKVHLKITMKRISRVILVKKTFLDTIYLIYDKKNVSKIV
jgi:hypothetical protein